ncbi:acetyl-CoA carboxylase biotin carboxylase subunit family protein [Enterococcus sp. UD-01]|uniref:ATP-grasp domain-containing protein n=1 Tax=Enterococcus sp. UD-01 TaxID=3373911 RepID=UPI0038390E48
MEAIVSIFDYPEVSNYIHENFKEEYQVLICHKSMIKSDERELEKFNEVIKMNNIFDYDEVEKKIRDVEKKYKIANVVSGFELTLEIASEMRNRFGIKKGPSLEEITRGRNKYLMKKNVRNFGIKIANFEIVRSIEDVKIFVAKYDFPVVIKPLSAAGALNTIKINKMSELEQYTFTNDEYLVEEYILGEEYHCDSVIEDGKVVFHSVAKYLEKPINVENGISSRGSIIFPSIYEKNPIVKDIIEMNQSVVEALSISNSVCHAEFFVTDFGELYFGEIGLRVGGGSRMTPAIESVHGVDLHLCFNNTIFGLSNLKIIEKKENTFFSGWKDILATQDGYVNSIAFKERLPKALDLRELTILCNNNLFLKKRERIGYVNLNSSNYALLHETLTDINSLLQIK